MKKQTRNKLLAIATALLLTAVVVLPVLGTLRAKADNNPVTYTAISMSNITLTKILDIPASTDIPTSGFGFKFKIVPGTEIEAATDHFAVLPGPQHVDDSQNPAVTYPKIADVTFANGDGKDASNAPEATAYDSSITKTTTIDFTGVTFKEPGVYRYVITEEAADGYTNTGVGYDSYNQKILDVYIIDDPTNEGTLKVDSYTILKQNSTSAIGAPLSDGTNWDAALKSDTFVNKYPTNTLELKKIVTGNQGSRDQYFAFTIKVESNGAAVVEDSIVVGVSGQDLVPVANNATEYTADEMKKANNITSLTGAQLKAGYTMYLQNGDDVTFTGLVENCKFTITEVKKDYAVGTLLEQTGKADVIGASDSVSSTLDVNSIVTFTNNKAGTIPTGVILSVAPWAIAGVIILAGVIFFAIRSRRKFEEE